jgi:hypothetical protein
MYVINLTQINIIFNNEHKDIVYKRYSTVLFNIHSYFVLPIRRKDKDDLVSFID